MSQPKLATLLATAVERQIITSEQNAQILQLSQPQNQNLPLKVVISLLSAIGGTCLVFGVTFLISAGWWLIPDLVKIAIFILFFITVYLAALITEQSRPNISHVLYTIVAMLPMVGIGLISKIYHISLPLGGLALWGLTTLALGILLRQAEILLLALGIFYFDIFSTNIFRVLTATNDYVMVMFLNIIAWPLMI